ncbi:MAG: FecR family protein [Myxococcota bacterium]
MVREHLTRALALALGLVGSLAVAGSARADAPCGGLEVGDGAFVFKERLTLDLVQQPAGLDCLKAVAAEIEKRADMQSVTIAARVPNDKAMREKGFATATFAAEKLAAFGVPRSLVSTVVPTARPDEKDAIYIAFVQRRSARPVAQIQAVSGKVTSGAQLGSLRDTAPGAMLVPTDFLETGKGSVALLKLLDGSKLFVMEGSILRMGQVDISPQGTRNVRIQMLRGESMVWAAPMEGPLDFVTGNATAGVRGTDFRLSQPEVQMSRLESLDGTVVFKGKAGDVFVPGGKGSKIDFKGRPEEPRPLLIAPTCEAPLFGFARTGDFIRWKPVPNAQSYRLEIADNAQFTKSWWGFEVTQEKWLISDQLQPGKHFWRVTPIDPEGFLGYPSKVYAFTLR